MEKEQYRIDRAYEKIYEYDKDQNAYLFLATFLQVGAKCKNRDKTIIKKIKDWKYHNFFMDCCYEGG